MQSEAKVHVTGNVYSHTPNTLYIEKTHLIPQLLSLNIPRLNQNQRIQALTVLARGDNVSNVRRAFGCHRNTLIRLRQRFQETGGVADRYKPSNGQVHYADAPSTSFSNGDKFCKAVRYQQTDSVAQPQASPVIHSAKEGQVLTARHRAARLQWAQRHFRRGRQQWARVLFCDESRFNLSHHEGGIRVFRRRGERFADNCLIERDRFGGGSVMVWGGIMGRRKTNLIVVQGNLNAQGYTNQILQPEAVPFLQRHGPAILMHDNARPHVARIFRQFLNRHNVNVLSWPVVSPDMNPIEHIWDYFG